MTETRVSPRKQTHLTTHTPLLIDPDAPEDFGTGRGCDRCKAKVNRYKKPHRGELLCEPCLRAKVDERMRNPYLREPSVYSHQQGVKLPNLARIRREKNISQKQLAKMAQVSNQYISSLEAGQKGASEKVRRRLAKALGVAKWEMSEE